MRPGFVWRAEPSPFEASVASHHALGTPIIRYDSQHAPDPKFLRGFLSNPLKNMSASPQAQSY
jgi:hypothetical protein